MNPLLKNSASEMTYIVSGGALNSTHSLTLSKNGSRMPNDIDRPPVHSTVPLVLHIFIALSHFLSTFRTFTPQLVLYFT